MNLLIVGSLSLDTVETPYGKVEDVLGGSTAYVSAAASYFAPVRIVGIVGDDFPMAEFEFLKARNVDFAGLVVEKGKTFRWGGRYHKNMNIRDTLFTELNVFENFNPVVPPEYADSEYVFLANIQPDLQLHVLEQMKKPKFVAMDTMNFWISGMPKDLEKIISKVDLLIVNDQEIQELSGEDNLFVGARKVQAMGPDMLIVKKGEHGALLINKESYFQAPAFPLEQLKDPTGAGDSFAGGFMGYLAGTDDLSEMNLRRAVIYGSALASFCVEDFSLENLKQLKLADIRKRFAKFHEMTHFDASNI
ncbi:sugar kinase [candidate division KSB1 bacterium]|nr:sugar kinase [candidate division KSB1 bacterium]